MKLSCCIGNSVEKAEILTKVGYKYCEVSLAAMAKFTDEEFAAFKAKIDELGMTVVSANGMFPGEINLLLGKDGYKAVEEYLDRAFPRAKASASR